MDQSHALPYIIVITQIIMILFTYQSYHSCTCLSLLLLIYYLLPYIVLIYTFMLNFLICTFQVTLVAPSGQAYLAVVYYCRIIMACILKLALTPNWPHWRKVGCIVITLSLLYYKEGYGKAERASMIRKVHLLLLSLQRMSNVSAFVCVPATLSPHHKSVLQNEGGYGLSFL